MTIDINPIAFHIPLPLLGWWPIYLYGISWLVAILLINYAAKYYAPASGDINKKLIDDFIFYGVLGAIIGGRFGYMFFYGLDSLFTAQKISDYFIWTKKNNKFSANYSFRNRPMRQMISEKFLENGSFYIFNSKKFLKTKCRLFGKIGCFVMDKIYSFQIDDFDDVKIIKKLTNYI